MISESDINTMAQLILKSRKQGTPDQITIDRLESMGYSKYDIRKVIDKANLIEKKEALSQKIASQTQQPQTKKDPDLIEPKPEKKPKTVLKFLNLIGKGKEETKPQTQQLQTKPQPIQPKSKQEIQPKPMPEQPVQQPSQPQAESSNEKRQEEIQVETQRLKFLAKEIGHESEGKEAIEAKPIINKPEDKKPKQETEEKEIEIIPKKFSLFEQKEKTSEEVVEHSEPEIIEEKPKQETEIEEIHSKSDIQNIAKGMLSGQTPELGEKPESEFEEQITKIIKQAKLSGHSDKECIEILLKAGFDAQQTERIMSKILFAQQPN